MINSAGSALKGPVQTPLQSCAEPVVTDKNQVRQKIGAWINLVQQFKFGATKTPNSTESIAIYSTFTFIFVWHKKKSDFWAKIFMLVTPSSQHGLFYSSWINSSVNISWSKKKGAVLNPLRPSLVLKKISTLGFCGISRTTTTRKRWFKVFSHILKKSTPRKASLYLFFYQKG